jgi:disulfide bond formation protein DsbB
MTTQRAAFWGPTKRALAGYTAPKENAMKKIVAMVMFLGLFGGIASAQIKGCTADIRTGVCNKACSVAHVEGCTLEQLKPLLLIHHMDCLAKGTDKAVCSAEVDKATADWKAAQKKRAKK